MFLNLYVVPNNVCEKFFFLPSPELQTCGLNATMATSKGEEKERFFNTLYLLDHFSDDEEVLKPLSMPLQRHSTANLAPDVVPLQRPSKPTTVPKPMRAHRSTSSYIASEAEPPQGPTMKHRRPTAKRPPPPPVSSKPSNGKKGKQSKTIPEAHRIFTGSVFYFIPNDDVAAPRKMRIQRALQYGATWERVWSAEVTYVVVDSNIKMPDVLKNLRVAKLPVSVLPCHVEVFLICFCGQEDTVVVNDAWLTESISYREMRDPEAKRFRIQGSVDPVVPKAPIAAMTRVRLCEDAEQTTDQESESSDEDLDELQSAHAPPEHESRSLRTAQNVAAVMHSTRLCTR